MSNVLDSVQNTSYVAKDFQTIFPELLDLVKQMTTKWDPSLSNESDPGVILLKLNALLGDKLNYNIDKNVLECFPLSVTQVRNARQMYEQLGYKMHWYQAPTTEINMKWISDTSQKYVTIPAFTMISNSDTTIVYTLVGPTNATSETGFVVADQTLKETGEALTWKAIQGTAIQYDINGTTVITASSLDSNNRIYFNSTDVAQNGIFITNITYDDNDTPVADNNYSDWIQKDNLLTEQLNNTYYSFGVSQDTNVCYLEFPEDAENVFKSGIMITYIRTKGVEGNVPALAIEKFFADVTLTDNEGTSVILNSDNVKILNYTAATDGEDPESINDAYKSYGKIVGTFDTLVTLRDYINYVITNKLVSNGFFADRTTDPQCCYTVVVNNDGVTQSKTVVDTGLVASSDVKDSSGTAISGAYIEKAKLTAFDLKMFLMHYTTDFTTASGYNTSFTPITDTTNIEDFIADQKSISHDYRDIDGITLSRSNICFLINKYPVNCRIVTKYQLSTTQAEEVKNNVVLALFQGLNSQEIEFGENITTELLTEIIVNADARVKSVSVDNIEYSTFAVYWKDGEESDDGETTGKFAEIELTSDTPNYVDCEYEYTTSMEYGKYQASNQYYKYDFCVYNGHRYICTKEAFSGVSGTIPAKGPFNTSHWKLCDLNFDYSYENYQTLVNKLGFGNYSSIEATFPQSSTAWVYSYDGATVTRDEIGLTPRMVDYDTIFHKGSASASGSNMHTTRDTQKVSVSEIIKVTGMTGTITSVTATSALLLKGVKIIAPTATDNDYYISLPDERIATSDGSFTVKTSTDTTGKTFYIEEKDSVAAANTLIPTISGTVGTLPQYSFRVSVEEQMRDEIYGKAVLCGCTPLYISDETIDYKWPQFKEWDAVIYRYVATGSETVGNTYKFKPTSTSATYYFTMPSTRVAGSQFKFDLTKAKLTCDGVDVAVTTSGSGSLLTFTLYEENLAPDLTSPFIDDIETIITNSDVTLTSVNANNYYKLNSNESIQMYRPNLLDARSYSNYVKMEHTITKDIPANTDYQLKGTAEGETKEFIAFYWKVQGDDSEYYSYYIYGPGSIIKPSFVLQSQNNSGGGREGAPTSEYFKEILQVGSGEDPLTKMNNVGTTANPIYTQSSATGPAITNTTNEKVAKLTKTYWVLSGTKEIKIRKINEIELDDSYQYYIISNNTDSSGNYVFEFNDKYQHTCSTSEQGNNYYFTVNTIDYYFTMPSTVTNTDVLTFTTENKKLKLNNTTSVSVSTDELDDAIEISFTKVNTVSQKMLSTGEYFIYTNSAFTDFVIFGSGTKLVQTGIVGGLKSTAINLSKVLTEGLSYVASQDAWNQLPVDSTLTVQENQYVNITSGNYFMLNPISGSSIAVWTVNMNHEGTTFEAYTASGSVVPNVSFADFTISYGTDYEELTELEALELSGSTTWNGRTLLALSLSETTDQILYGNQSIEVIQYGSTTSVTIKGSDKVGDLFPKYESSAQTNWYRSCLLSTEAIEFSGEGEYSAAYYDSTGAIQYPGIYLTSKNITNTRVAYTTDGDVILMFDKNTVGDTSESFKFNLPDGDYIVKFLGSSSAMNYPHSTTNPGVRVVITDDAGSAAINVPTMYTTPTKEVGIQRSTFLRMSLTSGYDSIKTMTVTIPKHNEKVTITLYNPFKYTHAEEIDDFYFSKMETIVRNFDTYNQFDYTYEVDSDDKILYPLKPTSFLNQNHPYYKYTICKLDTSIDFNEAISVLNKK